METIEALLNGFSLALTPELLLAALVGAIAGTLVGVLPGIGPVAGAALILPLTFAYSPAVGLIMIAGIYLGGQYGGSTTSVLLNIPGEGSAVVATFDGYKMTQKGRGGAALTIMAVGSFLAGTIALFLIVGLAKPLAQFGLQFGPSEYFALTAGGLLALARISGGKLGDGLLPMIIGVALSTVGLEAATGFSRFTFGNLDLTLGFGLPAVAVGLFGLSEIMLMIEDKDGSRKPIKVRLRELLPTRTEWRRAVPSWIRGSFIGFIFGLLPVPSATLSTFSSYKVEQTVSKYRKEIGTGAVEGIAGPEAANNSAALGSLVPVLVLGLPFSATLALMLSAMVVQGVQPGPLMMTENPDLFWSIIAAMYVANLMLLVLNLPLVGVWIKVLQTPRYILIPVIIVIAVIGAFSINANMLDVAVVVIFGVVGYFLRKLNFSLASLLVGLVLGPLIEKYFRTGLFISGGDASYFFTRPISAVIWGIVLAVLIGGTVMRFVRRGRDRRTFSTETGTMSIDADDPALAPITTGPAPVSGESAAEPVPAGRKTATSEAPHKRTLDEAIKDED
jgi:putative tricarboxylic transport membrane protein